MATQREKKESRSFTFTGCSAFCVKPCVKHHRANNVPRKTEDCTVGQMYNGDTVRICVVFIMRNMSFNGLATEQVLVEVQKKTAVH